MKEFYRVTLPVIEEEVDLINSDQIIKYCISKLGLEEKRIISNHNLHSIYMKMTNKNMERFYSISDIIHIDGFPIWMLAKIRNHRLNSKFKTTYLDWIDNLFIQLNHWEGCRILYVGGRKSVNESVIRKLQESYPNLNFMGLDGYGEQNEDDAIDRINEFRPNLIFVGMGMPIQEEWILKKYSRLHCDVIFQCGAALEYYLYPEKKSPRLLSKIGFEWAFRFMREPKKFWRRYFVEPIILVAIIATRKYRRMKS